MKPKNKRNRNHKQRVKLMLLAGKKLTKRGLDRLLDVTNSAEIVRRLRLEDRMNIKTVWKVSSNGIRYGEYIFIPTPKVSRISTRAYMEQV